MICETCGNDFFPKDKYHCIKCHKSIHKKYGKSKFVSSMQ
jgi:uncharacterized OB-fold protein